MTLLPKRLLFTAIVQGAHNSGGQDRAKEYVFSCILQPNFDMIKYHGDRIRHGIKGKLQEK
ncbi:hypothetical protein C1H46_026851 [Malus baccata]|uniref:Uncharacterized protein n=1 Tax=Malus baccata TaxID=106549 RepID=A0A540LN10_MALBA|nr:hypothetical protein C1H46_026851 [Malus baccata]